MRGAVILKRNKLKTLGDSPEHRAKLVKRPSEIHTWARIDLGEKRGVYDIPHAVAVYIDEIFQEGAAIHTRVATRREMLKPWMDREPPRILSIFGGTALKRKRKGG